MKLNKKWITAVAVFALGASLAVAAPNDGDGKAFGHEHGHRHRGEFSAKFAQKLNLTDAQKQQIRDMHKSFRAENQAFFDSFRQSMHEYRAAKQAGDTAKADALKVTLESQRAQMKELHQGLEQRVGTVLTADQLAQWNTMKAERAARRAERQQNRQR
jgi:periplasmic protein CpxP/Spy